MTVVALILFVILMLLLLSIHTEKKAIKNNRMVNALNKKVYVDALTSVRNKGGYTDYMHNLQERMNRGEVKDLAVCMFDCDDLKYINDKYGHDMGDEYLKNAVRLICRIFQHSPVFRVGGDEFTSVLQNDDYSNRDELIEKFYDESRRINEAAHNEWEKINVSLGIALYDEKADKTVEDTTVRADEKMYENKRIRKKKKKHRTNKLIKRRDRYGSYTKLCCRSYSYNTRYFHQPSG